MKKISVVNLIKSLLFVAVFVSWGISCLTYAGNVRLSFFLGIISVIALFFLSGGKSVPAVPLCVLKKEPVLLIAGRLIIAFILMLLGWYFFLKLKRFEAVASYTFAVLQLALLFRVESIGKASAGDNGSEPLAEHPARNIIIFSLGAVSIIVFYLSFINLLRPNIVLGVGFLFFAVLFSGYVYNRAYKNIAAKDIKIPVIAEYLLVVLLVVAAYLIRTYKIGAVPPGASLDEGFIWGISSGIMKGGSVPIFLGNIQFLIGSLYYYLVAGWAMLTSLTLENVRTVSAIAGTLNVLFVYLLLKQMYDKKTGFAGAFVLTFLYFQIIYSRIAWTWIFVPALASVTLYFYFLGEKKGNPFYYMLAGAFLGINLYFYNAAKMMPFVFVSYWLYLLLSKDKRAMITANWKLLAVFVLSGIVVFYPMINYIIHVPANYFDRINQQNIYHGGSFFAPHFLTHFINHAKDTLLMFTTKGSGYGYFNYPFEPLLDKTGGFFVLIGAGYVFYNWKNRMNMMMLLLFVFSIVAAIFSYHPGDPNTQRAILSILPVTAFIALGFVKTWDILSVAFKRIGSVVLPITAAVLAVFFVYSNLNLYFNKYADSDNIKSEFFYYPYSAASFMNRASDAGKKVFGSPYWGSQVTFVCYNGYDNLDPGLMELNALYNNQNKDAVIVTEGIYHGLADIYKEYFPNAKIKRHWDVYTRFTEPKYNHRGIDMFYPNLLFISVDIPYSDIQELYGFKAKYIKGNKTENKDIYGANVPNGNGMDSVRVESLIYIPADGNYSFGVSGAKAGTITVDGLNVSAKTRLIKGLHRFYASINGITAENAEFTWNSDKPGINGVIPAGYFIKSDKIFGLNASYTVDGKKAAQQIEPGVTHRYYYYKPRVPYNLDQNNEIEWTGGLKIEKSGDYYFRTKTPFKSKVIIDGVVVYSGPDAEQKDEKKINLSRGVHQIKITYGYKGNSMVQSDISSFLFMYKAGNKREYSVVPYNMLVPGGK